MLASEITFQQMRVNARCNHELGYLASYMQVEYGIKELECCWDGFVHTSDFAEQEFKNRKAVCTEFTHVLSDYLEYLGESPSFPVGQEVSEDS